MLTTLAQRWREGRATYRPSGELFDPRGWFVEEIHNDRTPRAFVAAHHYLRTLPPTRRRFGLYAPGGALAGVAVFCVPSRDEVLSPLPGGRDASATLGRFVFPLAAGAKRDVKRVVGAGLPYVKLCDVGLCSAATPKHRPGCTRNTPFVGGGP